MFSLHPLVPTRATTKRGLVADADGPGDVAAGADAVAVARAGGVAIVWTRTKRSVSYPLSIFLSHSFLSCKRIPPPCLYASTIAYDLHKPLKMCSTCSLLYYFTRFLYPTQSFLGQPSL